MDLGLNNLQRLICYKYKQTNNSIQLNISHLFHKVKSKNTSISHNSVHCLNVNTLTL